MTRRGITHHSRKLIIMWKDPRRMGGTVKLEIDRDKATPGHYEMLDAVAETVADHLAKMRDERRRDSSQTSDT